MFRSRLTLLVTLLLTAAITAPPALAGALLLDLREDPLASGRIFLEGPATGRLEYDSTTPPAYPSDPRGSLRARYEASMESVRAVAPLGETVTEDDDFVFGALFTIRPESFHADPFGFHPITFSLINVATTGMDRTGDLSDFRADTFDSLELAYFPQISPIFGGPYISPSVFGAALGDDAFANFAFGSMEFEIVPGLPHLAVLEHLAAERRLAVTVYALGPGGRPVPLPGGFAEADLAGLDGFAVDALAIPAYRDGFNIYAPSGLSLEANVDYERLFFATGRLGPGGGLPSLMGLIRGSRAGAAGLGAH